MIMEISKLSKVCFEVTNQCNERCKYCFAFNDEGRDLSYDNHIAILDKLVKRGVKQINWSGGECLLLPHLLSLLKHAKKHGIFNALDTNGIILTDAILCKLKNYVDRINLSINSLSPQTNQAMGREQGYEKLVLNKICNIQKNNIPFRISTVVSNINKDDISALGLELARLDVRNWLLVQFSPIRNCAITNENIFNISEKTFFEVAKNQQINYPQMSIDARTHDYFRNDYFQVTPRGVLVVNKNSQDIVLENLLCQNNQKDM